MQRTGREGRGTRRLLFALAAAGAGIAVLAALVWRETRGRGAPDLAPSARGASEQGAAPAELVPAPGEVPPASAASAAVEEPHAEAAPSGEPARVAAPLGPRGRVADRATGEPVAGVVIERKFAGSVDHRETTGPDGVFAFGPEVNENGTLRAVKFGWRFTPASLRPRHAPDGKGLLFEGERLILAPVRGRVVDEATGRPVPRYRLWFGQPGFDESQLETPSSLRVVSDGERLRGVETASDEQGRFATPALLEQGTVKVRLLEGSERREIDHLIQAGEGAEHELSVALGPTYFFDLDLPDGVEPWQLAVELVDAAAPLTRDGARAAETGGWRTRPFDGPPSAAGVHGLPRGAGSPVRTDGDPSWARLAPLDPRDPPVRGPAGYALLVRDADAFLSGLGYAGSVSGVQRERIKVRLEPMSALDGSVTAADGERVGGALVTLKGGATDLSLACATGRSGSFQLRAPPGRYDLAVDSLRGRLRQEVELGAGETRELSLQLPAAELMPVSGTIEATSGRLAFEPRLELRSAEDPGLRFPAHVKLLDTGDGMRGTFRFDRVPQGSYELLAPPCMGCALEPARTLITGPEEGLELLCHDGAGGVLLFLAAVDEQDLELSSARAWFWVEGDAQGPTTRARIPAGASVRWLAAAEGRAPEQGVYRASAEPEQYLRVELARGPGVAVVATDPWGAGLEGVEILLDGRSAGRTDERGALALALRDEPLALEARKRGWVCEAAELQPELGMGFARLGRAD